MQKIQDQNTANQTGMKFIVEIGDGAFEEIMTHGTLCEYSDDLDNEDLTSGQKFRHFHDVLEH
jgi:hypothetical protein